LFNLAASPYVQLDRYGLILNANLPFTALTGKNRKMLVGSPFVLLLPGWRTCQFIDILCEFKVKPFFEAELKARGMNKSVTADFHIAYQDFSKRYQVAVIPKRDENVWHFKNRQRVGEAVAFS
jgi:hypothetical protein